jgi:hypothetical protein
MQSQVKDVLHVTSYRDKFASHLTMQYLNDLTPLPHAKELLPAAVCLDTPSEDMRENPRPGIDPDIWAPRGGRLLPHRLAEISPEHRGSAALAAVLALEDGEIMSTISTTRMIWAADKKLDRIRMRSFLLPGAMIIAHWDKCLALHDRSGTVAQDHIKTHFSIFIDCDLSSHELIEIIPGVEATLSDLASYGAHERHLMDSMKSVTPPYHRVKINI